MRFHVVMAALLTASLLRGSTVTVLTSGTPATYSTEDVEQIIFPVEGGVAVSLVSGVTHEYGAADFVSLVFESSGSGVGSVPLARRVSLRDGELGVEGASELRVCSTSGVVLSRTAGSRADLSRLGAGVYIVVADGETFKIIVP